MDMIVLRRDRLCRSPKSLILYPQYSNFYPLLLPLEMPVKKPERHVARVGGKIVFAVGVIGLQIFVLAVQFVNRTGGGDRVANPGNVEVAVADGAARQKRSGGERGHDLGEIERHLVGVIFVDTGDPR